MLIEIVLTKDPLYIQVPETSDTHDMQMACEINIPAILSHSPLEINLSQYIKKKRHHYVRRRGFRDELEARHGSHKEDTNVYESAAVNLDSCDVFRSIQDPYSLTLPQMDGRHSIPCRHDPDVVGELGQVLKILPKDQVTSTFENFCLFVSRCKSGIV